MPDLERKLVAILSADAAGYSRLMADDETETIVALQACRARIREAVERSRGRVVDAPGDNVLAEFPTALDAAQAAIAIQAALAEQNAELPVARRMQFRIGIHLGDVATDGERIYGDGVNIAARIEALADVGGIAVSGEVHGQIRGRLGVDFEDLGERNVKNIPQPVRVYRVVAPGGASAQPAPPAGGRRNLRRALIAAAAVGIGAAIYLLAPQRPEPSGDSSDPSAGPPSIAVLPFANLSADPANEYFSDGLSEELLNSLAQVPGLKVAARTSSFAFKNQNVDLREVGARLGVRNVLEGSVRKQAQSLRITAQLINAADNYHLWSQTYDRHLDDVFEIQADIARRVTEALRVKLMQADAERLATPDTQDTAAHDAYLHGLEGVRVFTVDSIVEAERHFRRAIALDPGFAKAHAALANAYALSYITNPIRSDEMLRVAKPAAARALELDPGLSEAYSARAVVLEQADPAAAEAAYRRALELKPANRDASFSYGLFLLDRLRSREAIAVYEEAIETDPLDAGLVGMLGQAYRVAGRTGDALETLTRSRALNEQSPFGYFAAGYLYLDDLGDLAEGLAWFERSSAVDPADPELVAFISRTHLLLGEVERGVAIAERARAMDPGNDFLSSTAALAYARSGDSERAEELALHALRPDSVRRLGGPLDALRVLRNAWLRDGRLEELVAAYEAAYPTLTRDVPLLEGPVRMPELTPSELASAAVDLAHLRTAAGDAAAAAALLARARSVFEREPRVQTLGSLRPFITPIEILILESRENEALDALEALVDSGWRTDWQWQLVWNPIFDGVRDDPRYQRLIEVLERDTQRFRQTVAARAGE